MDEPHASRSVTVPVEVVALADGATPELVWRNELGGMTFRLPGRYVKWNPRATGIDLDRETVRLRWLHGRHPVPCVVEAGSDAASQWLVTDAIDATSAVDDVWRQHPTAAITAMAAGLRALHALSIEDVPSAWSGDSWVTRRPSSLGRAPSVARPVIVHGDACAPNTLMADAGRWAGHVDMGDVALGDRWADLAVASMSLDWNFGHGHQEAFFDAYGIEPDAERISYYRRLWDLES